jgi:ATP-dependent Clp protease ATP-binding subunit ClpA
MPKINVYLPDDLAEAVKDAGLPVSAICQRALEQGVRRVTAVRELAAGGRSDPVDSAAVLPFTARLMTILKAAQAASANDGLPALDSGHLLRSLVSDRDSMAVRVLAALDITPRQVRGELDRRIAAYQHEASAPTGFAATLSPEVAKVVELATNESSGLGTGFVGTEHLLLGLIGEADGVAGHVLRSLGADLRVTRRTVAAAQSGWDAGSVRAVQQHVASQQADQIAAAVRAELEPLLARIARLEDLVAS